MLLENKVVFITGGAQGFGKALAVQVLQKGAKVCIADIKAEQGNEVAKELVASYTDGRVLFVKCDVSNKESFKDAFQTAVSKFGYVDVMCNNAGIMNEGIWEKQIEINFTAVVRGTQFAVDLMRTDKGGKGGVIINTASMAGLLPSYWFPVYSATKSAVQHFTNCCAMDEEVKAAGVRFMNICPAAAQTNLIADLDKSRVPEFQDFKDKMDEVGYCRVEQVVEAFLKAMGDDSLNGASLVITGKGVKLMKLTMEPAE